jgi:Na+-translocating ferredoxin:NAD+ oxidoreductase RnfE subunit
MLIRDRVPKYLLIIPSLWAIVGLTAAINFGVYQDFMMIIAAITANGVLIKRKNKATHVFKSSETSRAHISN